MPSEQLISKDWLYEPLFDEEGMTRVTATCDNGHIHVHVPVAKVFAHVGVSLNDRVCLQRLDSDHVCKSTLKVTASQATIDHLTELGRILL